MADLAKYDPNDPNNPLKVGNIIKSAAQGILSAGSGSDAVANNPMTTFAPPASSPAAGIRPSASNDTIAGMQTGTTPAGAPIGVRPIGSGAIWDANTGQKLAYTTGTPQDAITDATQGSAFQQNYDYLAKPKQPQASTPVSAPATTELTKVQQAPWYSPGDTTDTSFGGMFMQGLRGKQDRNYATLNDMGIKNQLAARAQDVTLQGQTANAANDAERNRIAGIRGASQSQLEGAQATASNVETAQKIQAADLFNKMNSTTDPTLQKKYADQYALLTKQVKAPVQPHIGTVTDAMGQQHVFATQTDPTTGGIRMSTEQDILTPQQQLRAATQGMTTKQLTQFADKAKTLSPTDHAAALALAQEITRKK